jgi:hypothetical protein
MNGKILFLRRFILTTVLLTAFLLPASAFAMVWCGMNGQIRFSFAEGDSLVDVLHTVESTNGVTTFDLYAWLTDIDPVAFDGEAFLFVGMVEFKLTISGAEAFILEQEFPSQALNIGKEMGHVVAALVPGERIRDGKVFLVRWKVLIKGLPENVRFGLDSTQLTNCRGSEGCDESEPAALYLGITDTPLSNMVSGAGYVPSWLNPVGEPDQTPITGKGTWRDVGVFEER